MVYKVLSAVIKAISSCESKSKSVGIFVLFFLKRTVLNTGTCISRDSSSQHPRDGNLKYKRVILTQEKF